jgi:hypothetical protein
MCTTSGRDETELRKIGPVPPGISGQECQSGDGRVRANEEIRQRARLGSTATPIPHECFGRQERRFPRQ